MNNEGQRGGGNIVDSGSNLLRFCVFLIDLNKEIKDDTFSDFFLEFILKLELSKSNCFS